MGLVLDKNTKVDIIGPLKEDIERILHNYSILMDRIDELVEDAENGMDNPAQYRLDHNLDDDELPTMDYLQGYIEALGYIKIYLKNILDDDKEKG